MEKDDLYSTQQDQIKNFVFDDKVASVFEDMIDRSVPGYRDIVAMIGVLAEEYVTPGSRCYDLGCSLGAVSLVMQQSIKHQDYQIIAVDKSEAMVKRCQENMASGGRNENTQVLSEDIQNVKIEKASLVVLNFTLQFVDLEKRAGLIKSIYEGMIPGGILVVSEKIRFEEEAEQNFQTEIHHAFKKMHGYSDLEISQKRTALENVLIPETCADHQKRFEVAGFKRSHRWFQCFNFASFLAIK